MRSLLERVFQILVALIAVMMLIAGSFREHKVYDNPKQEYGLRNYIYISEYQLVEDATFSGTIRRDADLYSTYNRAEPKGKMACPT
jgi:hypothetical protein